jgi:hypothetical protein
MFEDDPEMQEMIKRANAEPEPEPKPLWFQAVLVLLMLGGGGLSVLIPFVLWRAIDPRVGAFGLFAGGLGAIGLLGWRPGRYQDFRTEEKMTLWKPIKLWLRGLYFVGALAVFVLGIGIALYDLGAP